MRLAVLRMIAILPVLASASGFCAITNSCALIHTFADGKQPLREIFVSPTGDNAGDGTRSKPYQTMARALQGIRPGDAIRLLPGNHSGGASIRNVAGTSDTPIWIGGVPGQPRPVITGGSMAIQLSKVRFLVIENLEVSKATGNGINCDDGADYANSNATRHVIFRNLSIHDIGTGRNNDGLKLSGVNDYFVLDCEFARMSAGGSGIDQVGCHHGLIAGCTFSNATGSAGNAVQCKGGSEDIEVRASRFIDSGGRAINIGGSTGFEFFRPPISTNTPSVEAKNIRVIANLFRGSDAPIAFVGTINSLVANNTIVEPRRWIVRVLQETVSRRGYTFLPCSSNQFINNLVYFDRSQLSTPVNIGANTDAASFAFAHNLWYAFNQPNQSKPALPSAEVNGIYGLDPRFSAQGESNYSIRDDSPAVGKGRKWPNANGDLLGQCFADAPAIGAFEARR